MEALLYFLLWGVFIFLMMRFGCGAHVMGHGKGKKAGCGGGEKAGELRWTPPRSDVDPVCGQTVSTDTAKPSVVDGNVHYFCSRECREIFEASPKDYLGNRKVAPPQALEHHHG